MLIGNREYDSIVIKDEFNCVLAIIDDNSILQKNDWSINNRISIEQEPTSEYYDGYYKRKTLPSYTTVIRANKKAVAKI